MADLYERTSDAFITGVTREEIVRRHRRRGISANENFELLHTRPDGPRRVLGVSATPLVDETRYVGSLAMITEITAVREAENEFVYRATHDPLTGLANRALLLQQLQESLDRSAAAGAGSIAVPVADVDQFNLVNDSYGHAAGRNPGGRRQLDHADSVSLNLGSAVFGREFAAATLSLGR